MRLFFLLIPLLLLISPLRASFLDEQLKYSRVRAAYAEKKELIDTRLEEMGLTKSNHRVMVKAYKYEQIVRVFVRSKSEGKWKVYRQYPFCWFSGELGPKRKQGDFQIPEGYYKINHFNPYSTFHLSLGVSYPNKADRIKSMASDKGGAIYMHGGCATIGCIPIEDEPIKEVYILSVLAINNGQSSVPIHIFPFDYSRPKFDAAILKYPEHQEFWSNLFESEQLFIQDSVQRQVSVNSSGNYFVPS